MTAWSCQRVAKNTKQELDEYPMLPDTSMAAISEQKQKNLFLSYLALIPLVMVWLIGHLMLCVFLGVLRFISRPFVR